MLIIKLNFLILFVLYIYLFKRLLNKNFTFSLGIIFGILFFIFIPLSVLITTNVLEISKIDFHNTNLYDIILKDNLTNSIFLILYLYVIWIYTFMVEFYFLKKINGVNKRKFPLLWKRYLFITFFISIIIFLLSGIQNGGNWYISRSNFFKESGFIGLILVDSFIAFKIIFIASIIDIEFMSTPFDIESADFLDEMMDVYKISSSDLTNKPFIEYICKFNKPIILSTGASSLHEIQEAVSWIEKHGNSLALLHCVLNYPTPDENANLGMILGLKRAFPDKIIGYSDHTLPKDMKVLKIATLLGSAIIEKHFTHDKTLPGNDHYHAMDKEDLKIYLSNLERTFEIIGGFKVEDLEDEALSRANARRSLVASKNIPAGKIITKDDLTFKRPAHGVSPKFIDEVVGKIAAKDIQDDDVIQWNMFQ